jgi:membrane-bound lytic murein transglycosylase D
MSAGTLDIDGRGARKLKENYAYLGDWYLALAAYNCGLGAVQRAVKRAGKADYWYLCEKGYLKRETVHYVPKFLAISRILADSAAYGIDWAALSPAAHLDAARQARGGRRPPR